MTELSSQKTKPWSMGTYSLMISQEYKVYNASQCFLGRFTVDVKILLEVTSDHARQFSNWHDIYKVAKAVLVKQSDNCCNPSDTCPSIRVPFPI